MIPDHLIDKAAQAIVTGTGSKPLLTDMHPEDAAYARADARAALEAVAAHIWDEGEKVGYVHGQHDAHRFDPGPDYTETPNPYRASETA